MKILSIETSCDDTALTIFEASGGAKNARFKILANISNSQIKIHAQYGGVFPMLAKREHIKNLPILLEQILKEVNLTPSPLLAKERGQRRGIDLICVTHGPGLEPALWAGIVFAKELTEKWKVPLVPVNHMEGHIVSVFGKSKGEFKIPKIDFPVLSLLVSGGHTELILTKKWMDYKIIGETLDDAAGEAYDKVARMLGLTYPGGPKISRLAESLRKREINFEGTPQSDGSRIEQIFQQKNCDPAKFDFPFSLPRPMLHSKNFDFSFSGLKTAVLYLIRDLSKQHLNILQNDKIKQAIALEFENAVVETLVHKTKKALDKYKAKTIIVGGGVACNKHLQREMKRALGKEVTLLFPPKELTGDNAIMIGMAGYLQFMKNKGKVAKASKIKAEGNLRLK